MSKAIVFSPTFESLAYLTALQVYAYLPSELLSMILEVAQEIETKS
jgi:hypothetical protein